MPRTVRISSGLRGSGSSLPRNRATYTSTTRRSAARRGIAPELLEDLGPRHHPARLPEQQLQQAEFGVGEGDALALARHLAAVGVDHQIAHPQHAGADGELTRLAGGRPRPMRRRIVEMRASSSLGLKGLGR